MVRVVNLDKLCDVNCFIGRSFLGTNALGVPYPFASISFFSSSSTSSSSALLHFTLLRIFTCRWGSSCPRYCITFSFRRRTLLFFADVITTTGTKSRGKIQHDRLLVAHNRSGKINLTTCLMRFMSIDPLFLACPGTSVSLPGSRTLPW